MLFLPCFPPPKTYVPPVRFSHSLVLTFPSRRALLSTSLAISSTSLSYPTPNTLLCLISIHATWIVWCVYFSLLVLFIAHEALRNVTLSYLASQSVPSHPSAHVQIDPHTIIQQLPCLLNHVATNPDFQILSLIVPLPLRSPSPPIHLTPGRASVSGIGCKSSPIFYALNSLLLTGVPLPAAVPIIFST